MPDDHSNADDSADSADLYGQDAYDDDATRNEMADESLAERDDDDDVVGHDEYRDDVYEDDAYDDRTEYDEDAGYDDEYARDVHDQNDGGSWWDEGLIGLLLVAGIVLFFFPEPSTSAVGILLIGIGVVAWIVDALM